MISDLLNKIQQKDARLAVIGLGYVGLPLACEFARVGFNVLGIDIQSERVKLTNRGESPFPGVEPGLSELLSDVVATGKLRASVDYTGLEACDVILICVETPVGEDHLPRYDALQSALEKTGEILKQGALVIIESTTSPGTMGSLVKPFLEESSQLQINEGFYLGNCPERVMPGKLLANLRSLQRVVGGMTPETAETMVELYRHIVDADLDPVDCVTAELVKTVENTYRDVQIAFANEIALICEQVGGDVWKVRELVNKSPGRQMHYAGSGVGGPCIPKDPWLLASSVGMNKTLLRIIPAARFVNDFMPAHCVRMIQTALGAHSLEMGGARVLIMGYAYLEDTGETRNSPSQRLVSQLLELKADVVIHDPFILTYQGSLLEMASGCDVAVLMVKHQEYRTLDLKALKWVLRTPILVDGRGFFDKGSVIEAGLDNWAIGVAKDQG